VNVDYEVLPIGDTPSRNAQGTKMQMPGMRMPKH
jgi:hypothetical protein